MSRERNACFSGRRPLQVLALLIGIAPSIVGAQQLIVNSEVAEESLTLNGVRAIFFMRMAQWPSSGQPIKVFVLDDQDPRHVKFSKIILDVFPHQLRRNWDRLTYSGTGQAPIIVADENEMIRRVSTTPGAIGYVSEVKDSENVRGLSVE